MKKIVGILAIFFLIGLSSCSAPQKKISGTVIFQNVPNDSVNLKVFLKSIEDGTLHDFDLKVKKNKGFSIPFSGSGQYLFLIDSDTDGVKINTLTNGELDLSNVEEYDLAPVYLYKPFDFDVSYETVDNRQIAISWEDFPDVDYYGITITSTGKQSAEKKAIYLTDKNEFSYPNSAPEKIIDDQNFSRDDILAAVPFYRTGKELSSGEYIFRVIGIKYIKNIPSKIVESKEITIEIR